MKYDETLINITDKLCESNTMYSLVLLDAKALTLTLSGYRCFLDGKYIVCLNINDTLAVHSGYYEAVNLRFQPYFYNVNLSHDVIGMKFYTEMREKYGYPDFRLFRMRDNNYFGIIHISDEEYNTASLYFAQAKRDMEAHVEDVLWSCRARSDIISVLHIAEGAYLGKQSGLENEILRYINDNINAEITLESLCSRFNTNRTTISSLIKEKTGLPPMKYVLEVRLNQSRPDLLFTQLPINEIAEKYGFSDSNYYIRVFKKRFGKSPLQFRKDGWAERLRDEAIYHRRAEMEKTEMTVEEFSRYIETGLGRAIILLKKQKDKEPFKKVFFDFLFGEKRQMHRELDVYEKEILDIFDDKAYTDKIINRLIDEYKSENGNLYGNGVSLLLLFGYRNQVEEVLEHRYKTSYKELLEYTKKPWDGEKFPPFAKVYGSTCSTLARRIKVGDERIKQILWDIADLYEYCEYPVVPTYQNPLFRIWDGVGRDHFFVILDEVIKEHKHGKRIDVRHEMVPIPHDEDGYAIEDNPPIYQQGTLAKEILSHNDLTRDLLELWFKFEKQDNESVEAVAKAAIEETDIARKIYLLGFFNLRNAPYKPVVEFPLDVAPLVEWAEREDYILRNEPPYGVTQNILEILKDKRCDVSRKVGLKLFYDGRFAEGDIRYYALCLRFGLNYNEKEDRSDFVALMRSPNKEERNIAFGIFISNLRNNIEGMPLEMIPLVFENISPYWLRHDLCELLVEKGIMLPDELKEECLYDYNMRTRELFLKTQKPQKKPYEFFGFPPKMPEDK